MTDSAKLPDLTSPSAVLSTLSGVAYCGAVFWYANTQGSPVFGIDHPMEFYPILLLVAAGAVPAYLLAKRRRVTPAIVLALATFLWIDAEANQGGPGNPFAGFLGLLPLWIGLMVLASVGEGRMVRALGWVRARLGEVQTERR